MRKALNAPAFFVAALLLIGSASSSPREDHCKFGRGIDDNSNGREGASVLTSPLLHPHRIVEHVEVIFVLDPNFYLCWEQLPVNHQTKATILPWLSDLKDAFTGTEGMPDGNDLKLPDEDHRARELLGSPHSTFRELITDVLEHDNATVHVPSNLILLYQAALLNESLHSLHLVDATHVDASLPVNLSLRRLHVTAINSFWAAVLDTYSAEKEEELCPIGGSMPHFRTGLNNAVLLLPRIVPRLHDATVATVHGDNPLAWDVPQLVAQVQALLDRTGLTTLPSLQEWAILPDKRRLHKMYHTYYEEEPLCRTPPIPTYFLAMPGSPAELLALCHSDVLVPSQSFMDEVMRSMYEGMRGLEVQMQQMHSRGVNVGSISQGTYSEEEGELWHYVIKREFAEGAIHMTSFYFPRRLLQIEDLYAHDRGAAPWRAGPPLPLEAPQPSANIATQPYLLKAAELVAAYSCGEGWLLQPKIMDMPDLEYRVYLISGAEATGSPNDTVVVYTPSVLDNGIYMANLTLTPGYFWSDVIEPPSGGGATAAAAHAKQGLEDKLEQARTPWYQPELYQKIVNASLSGARAMAERSNGSLVTVSRMFVRVDVVLGVYWDEEGQAMSVVPLINEMDWFNSAAQMIPHWPQHDAQHAQQHSWGSRLAVPLLREIARRFDETRTS